MEKLRMTATENGGRWEVCLEGDLDAATLEAFTQFLDGAPAGTTIVLEMDSLMFMDSSGLRALLRSHLAGRRLVLKNPRPEVIRILQIAEVLDLFPVESDSM
jgi:anti-anti-sigma factor